jgi:hypothetical protein
MVRNLGLACARAASILVPLMLPINGSNASEPVDEQFSTELTAMALPAGPTGCVYPPPYVSPAPCKPLQSFDISYVGDAIYKVGTTTTTHAYYFLADRSNAAIDVFDAQTNTFFKFLNRHSPSPALSLRPWRPALVPMG